MKNSYEKKGYLIENFRLFHLNDAQGTNVEYHYHEFCKILILLSGTGSYFVEGNRYALKEGDIVLIGNQCVHRPEFEEGIPYERAILYIAPEFLERQSTQDGNLWECFSGKKGHVFRPNEKQKKILLEQVKLLEETISDDGYGRSILSNSILLRILVEIGRGLHEEKERMPKPLQPTSERILEITKYLDKHLTEDVTVEELSEMFYLSRFHLMRRFKDETGSTIHAYISERRLLMARDMIRKGLSTTEACYRCGFQSYATFARAYGKFFGTTPTGRKQQVAKEETYE